jgi:hypothetical protein
LLQRVLIFWQQRYGICEVPIVPLSLAPMPATLREAGMARQSLIHPIESISASAKLCLKISELAGYIL